MLQEPVPVEDALVEAERAVKEFGGLAENILAWSRENGVQWALALGIAAGIFLGLRLLRATLWGLFHRGKKPESSVPNIVAAVIRATSSLYLLVVSVIITLPFFVVLSERGDTILQAIFMVVSILQVAFWVRVIVKAFLGRLAGHQTAGDESTLANAMSLITVFVNVLIFAVALIVILDNLGMDVTGLVAGLGVGGIAIGLAAQSLFEDLFAGLSIILDKPFVKGDFIIFGDKMGSVERVGLKSTRIRTLSGQQLAVNNSMLLNNEINNYRRMAERRIVVKIGVTYSTPHDTLRRLPGQIGEIVERQQGVRFDRCHLASYADFSIVFELVFYVLSRDYNVFMDVQQEILLDVHSLFEREGIDFAFPTQTIHVGSLPQGAENRESFAAQ